MTRFTRGFSHQIALAPTIPSGGTEASPKENKATFSEFELVSGCICPFL